MEELILNKSKDIVSERTETMMDNGTTMQRDTLAAAVINIAFIELFSYGIMGYVALTFLMEYVWMPFKLYVLAQILPGIDLREQGKWAVITGATKGIGKY